jgi:hypothetical protein
MKFRRRNAPLILFLVPFASALSAAAQDNIQSSLTTKNPDVRDATKIDPNSEPVVDIAKPKYDVGTKDAPVDGKDGKPHAGPFVGSEKDPKKPKSDTEDIETVLGKEDTSELVTADGSKIPTVNDGVMNDPSRELPKLGTTGTEGGVSEKDKARKAQEGQTGEKLEKKPDSPKEAPPLPLSEDLKKSKTEKSKTKEVEAEDEDVDSLAGLEVRQFLISMP